MAEQDLAPTLRTFLLADAAILATVAQRVYLGVAPAEADVGTDRPVPVSPPFVVLGLADGRQDPTADGLADVEFETWQFDCWASSREAAVALGILVKARMKLYTDAFYRKKLDIVDMEPNSRAVSAFGRRVLFEIAYSTAE